MHWTEQQLAPADVWGGEAGANLMSNYIEPEIKTLYTKLSKVELMKKMMLVPDAKGDIEDDGSVTVSGQGMTSIRVDGLMVHPSNDDSTVDNVISCLKDIHKGFSNSI